MKENKEKEVVGEESRPETQAQVHPSAGDKKGSLCLKTWTLATSLADEAKRLSMCRPKQLSLNLLHLSRPSIYMM